MNLLPPSVTLREVGLRDGLQAFGQPLPLSFKCDWILLGHAAGLRQIEVGAFVAARQLPQMADTPQIVEFAKTIPGLAVSVVVDDVDGARSALVAGVDRITVPISASEAHGIANVGRNTAEMLAKLRQIRVQRDASGVRCAVEVGIGAAFGCVFQGDVPATDVLSLLRRSLEAGADCIGIGDTFACAQPAQVCDLFTQAREICGRTPLSAHFHGGAEGLENVQAALEVGVRRFDASLAGIGGSAIAPAARGNVCIEDVVALLRRLKIRSGIRMRTLLELRAFAGAHPGAHSLFDAITLAAKFTRGDTRNEGNFQPTIS